MSITLKKLPPEAMTKLRARGVSGGDFIFSKKEKIDVEDALVKYQVDIPRVQQKNVGTGKQFKILEKVFENPLRGHYVLGISSFPSDQWAKYLAIELMHRAFKQWQHKHRPGVQPPMWHRVFGGLGDPLRDSPNEKLSMLIISNINEVSTPHKIEKVRDLLERYNEIPRIVVMSGEDPLTFFGNRLHYQINAGIFLGPPNRITEV